MKRLVCALFALVFCSIGYSTTSLAAVSGTVTDTQGNPINHALVTFTSESDSTVIFWAVTDSTGHYESSDIPVGVREEAPLLFSLGQNYPNPFNPSTTIPFTLDAPGRVSLNVYNIMGQRIRTLINDFRNTGAHTVIWDACDDTGRQVGAGIYLYRLQVAGRTAVRKMLLLDGGGFSNVMNGTSNHVSSTKPAIISGSNLCTVFVERMGYTKYTQEHVDVESTATLNVTMQDSGELVGIPGGTFEMGDVENAGDPHEKPVHTVTLTGFEMSIYEVTNAQYCAYLNAALASGDIQLESSTWVYGTTGAWSGQMYLDTYGYYDYRNWCRITYNGGVFSVESGHENWPVVAPTWYGSKAFAQFYGLDLPTEAEWEYACRGGMQYMYGTDDGTNSSTKANWYGKIGHPVNVGSYPANPFGLHDMSGNVWEWCHDWYGNYTSDSAIDPTGPQTGIGNRHVERGGGWYYDDEGCRSAVRIYEVPDLRISNGGFRVVRRPGGVVY